MKYLVILFFIAYSMSSFLIDLIEKKLDKPTPALYVNPFKQINEGQSLLKEGDLVVRLNRDPSSQFIRNFNRHDKRYSHAGIVLFENGYPYVYHIVNGEENPDERMRKDSLSRFCNPGINKTFGIFRYSLDTGEMKTIKDIIHQWYAQGVRFDSVFNLNTDDRMYCSEMISKALARATHQRIQLGTTEMTNAEAMLFSNHVHLPLAYTNHLRIVSIDDLYTNPYCHLIKGFVFER
jgi:hypothetical protein